MASGEERRRFARSQQTRGRCAATRPRPRPDVAVEGASRIAGMSWLWSRTRMGTVEVAAPIGSERLLTPYR